MARLEDYQGIATGLNSFVDSFIQGQRAATEQASRDKMQKLQALQSGYMEDEQGNLVMTPESKAKMERSKVMEDLGLYEKGYQIGPDNKFMKTPERIKEDELKLKKLESEILKSRIEGKAPKELKADQANAANFLNRALQSEDKVASILKTYNPTTAKAALEGFRFTPNFLVSPEAQKFQQAKTDFITAILRPESGAVISEEELRKKDIELFPQPGDSDEVIAQKEQSRKASLQGLAIKAGQGGMAMIPSQQTIKDRVVQVQPSGVPGVSQAVASSDDIAALQWAKSNPKDPRAIRILRANGVQ